MPDWSTKNYYLADKIRVDKESNIKITVYDSKIMTLQFCDVNLMTCLKIHFKLSYLS